MRGENGVARPVAQYILMRGQTVYAVSIHNHRPLEILEHPANHLLHLVRPTKTGANQHRIHIWQPLPELGDRLSGQLTAGIRQGENHRLIQLHRLDLINALRNTQVHQPCTAAQSSPGRQSRRSGHAPASAEQKHLAEATLVPPGIPVRQEG